MKNGQRSWRHRSDICWLLLAVTVCSCHQPVLADPAASNGILKAQTAREQAGMQKHLDESRIRAIDEKIKILKDAEDRCNAIDRNAAERIQKLRQEQAYDAEQNRLTRSGFPGLNGSSLYDGDAPNINQRTEYKIQAVKDDAEKQKRSVMDEAHRRTDGWDAAVDTVQSELAHPGDTIQMMPHHGNPYVKDFMNLGDPPQVEPLRAKTLAAPQKPRSKNQPANSK